MFISFISTKEFFSVINRKIVENYKLNLFDITIDPFEFKIGFGENIHIKQKDIDTYYSYCATANMNGYRFFNPANVGNSVVMVLSLYVKDLFSWYRQEFFLNFLYTAYLLFFLFSAKIKIFPFDNKQENYNRFIEIFFSFYEFIFQQTGKIIDKKEFEKIKKELVNNVEIFFFLFYSYEKFNTLFSNKKDPGKEFYMRLFGDEIKQDQQKIIEDFSENIWIYTSRTTFWSIENKLLQCILPADILMRYLFLDTDMFLITETIISKVFNKEILDTFMQSFLKTNDQREDCIKYITDYKHFKKNFFMGVQKYIITILKKEHADDFEDDIDEITSWIGDEMDEENSENIKIPERIKKESKIMEKILNFFITFIGGFWISRGESFFIKLCRRELLQKIVNSPYTNDTKDSTLYFYGGMLYNYGKNIFYYKYISENVRLGRQRFYLPYKSTSKNTYSNFHILQLFDETNIAILLQDINPKDIRIYSKNKKLVDTFKEIFWKEISKLVKLKDKDCIETAYKNIQELMHKKNLISILQKYITSQDIYHIKENLYNIDFWISSKWYTLLQENKYIVQEYDDAIILGICAQIKETALGILLYLTDLEHEENNSKKKLFKEILIETYFNNILHLQLKKEEERIRKEMLENLYNQCKPLLEIIVTLDDNKDFLRMWYESRSFFIENKTSDEIKKKISGEDIIRFKGYLKNITYYNKRFLIPK